MGKLLIGAIRRWTPGDRRHLIIIVLLFVVSISWSTSTRCSTRACASGGRRHGPTDADAKIEPQGRDVSRGGGDAARPLPVDY
jgi:hypothetical protein